MRAVRVFVLQAYVHLSYRLTNATPVLLKHKRTLTQTHSHSHTRYRAQRDWRSEIRTIRSLRARLEVKFKVNGRVRPACVRDDIIIVVIDIVRRQCARTNRHTHT